jgi:hypothetical protein
VRCLNPLADMAVDASEAPYVFSDGQSAPDPYPALRTISVARSLPCSGFGGGAVVLMASTAMMY